MDTLFSTLGVSGMALSIIAISFNFYFKVREYEGAEDKKKLICLAKRLFWLYWILAVLLVSVAFYSVFGLNGSLGVVIIFLIVALASCLGLRKK